MLEVFVDYVLRGVIHLLLYSIGPIGPMGPIGPIGIFVCKDSAGCGGVRADCDNFGDLT